MSQSQALNSVITQYRPLDLRSVDYNEMMKPFEDLQSQIERQNKQNFERYKYFAQQQEDLLKNFNTDLSKVRPQDRLAIREQQLAGMKMVYENGLKDVLHDQTFGELNSKIAQDIQMSKIGQSQSELMEKQMSESADFNNIQNREKYKSIQSMPLEDLYKYGFDPITPTEAFDLEKERKRLYEAYATKSDGLYDDDGIIGVATSTKMSDEVWNQVLDASLEQTDKYGVSRKASVIDMFKEANPDKTEFEEQEAFDWYKSLFIKPEDQMKLTQIKAKPQTQEQKIELARIKGQESRKTENTKIAGRKQIEEVKTENQKEIIKEKEKYNKGGGTSKSKEINEQNFTDADNLSTPDPKVLQTITDVVVENGIIKKEDTKYWTVMNIDNPPKGFSKTGVYLFQSKDNKQMFIYDSERYVARKIEVKSNKNAKSENKTFDWSKYKK